MNLYVCSSPIKFPSSEYGGLIVAIAENPRKLGKMLTDHYKDYNGFDLSLSVRDCQEMSLDPKVEYVPGIVRAFIT